MVYFFQKKSFALYWVCLFVLLPSLAAHTQAQPGNAKSRPALKMAATHPLVKLGSELADLHTGKNAAATNTRLPQPITPFTKKSLLQIQNDYVAIEAIAEPNQTAQLLADLKALGLTKPASFGLVVSGYVPITNLHKVAALKNLHFARPAYKPMHNIGEVTTQGDIAMYADSVRKEQVLKGKGSKIGVLSDSYNSLGGAEKGIKSGDLPGKGNPNGYTTPVQVLEDDISSGNIDEGRAMLEIIHDIAPAAELAFHTAFISPASFAQGILDLQKAGCNIITDDVYWPNEPFFQDGIIAQAVDEVAEKEVAYFSAAGNSARDSYEAAFKNSGKNVIVEGVNYGVAHDFGNGDITQTIRFPAGEAFRSSLQWDDPFFSVSGLPGAQTDLDIVVYYEGEFLFSFSDKNIGNDALEYVGIINNSTDTLELEITIVKYSGPDPKRIKYINFGNAYPIDHNTKSSTIFGHSNAAGAVATGAVFWGDTPAYGSDELIAEDFSSAGGTPIYFDAEGNRITRQVRRKPEIMAPDGVNTSFFYQLFEGKYYFFGTSAAAPHAAAVAALMQESSGNKLSRDQIEETLQNTAIDMEEPGFDYDTGYGFINAFAAVEAVAKPGVRSFELVNAATNKVIQTVNEGDIINLTRLPSANVRLRALTGPMEVGSVLLELNGKEITENQAPYDYPGSSDNSLKLTSGDYTLTATPYTQTQGKGEAGVSLTVHFTVLEEEIVRFELINVATGKVIQTLETGDILYLPDLPNRLNIRAITSPAEVGSVQFNLNGIVTTENIRTYDLAGSSGQHINLGTGIYTLSATTYPADEAQGTPGDTETIFFGAANIQTDLASLTDKLNGKNTRELTVFPNPFASKAKIRFTAPETSSATLTIYNLSGQPVATLYNGTVEAGKQYEYELDGNSLPAGLYISRMVTRNGVIHRTIKLQK